MFFLYSVDQLSPHLQGNRMAGTVERTVLSYGQGEVGDGTLRPSMEGNEEILCT